MTPDQLLRLYGSEAGWYAPGLSGYAYHATIYCPTCTQTILRTIAPAVAPTISSMNDPLFYDSETLPQPIFFGESSTAQHCDTCGRYLYGPKEPTQ